MLNTIQIDKKDNVVIAITPIKKGSEIKFQKKNGEVIILEAKEEIIIYHKVASENIGKGGVIIKYGEHIGEASKEILKGEHVHIHNVNSVREEL